MPTYEYACRACGHEFELFQQMTESLKRKCPECGRLKLQRLIGTGGGIIFKGGGFYETDYRSDSYKKAAEAEKKAVDSPAANGEKPKTAAPASDGEKKTKKPKAEERS
jgi:putative FmdB family regulatory protein